MGCPTRKLALELGHCKPRRPADEGTWLPSRSEECERSGVPARSLGSRAEAGAYSFRWRNFAPWVQSRSQPLTRGWAEVRCSEGRASSRWIGARYRWKPTMREARCPHDGYFRHGGRDEEAGNSQSHDIASPSEEGHPSPKRVVFPVSPAKLLSKVGALPRRS